ncbi:hypothetical protein ABKA04_002128 [Annulohypoxylon sp. FPYF3050]
MRRTTIDAIRSRFHLLHRRRQASIPLYAATSSYSLTDRQFHTFNYTHSRGRSYPLKMATDNLRQLEALMNRLDQDRAALQQPSDVSSRTPNTISTTFNTADQIERHLRADGHRIWGLVVYRCTYTSDEAWESCIQRINASVREAMNLYNGHDLLEEGCFKLTVISDATTLDGASTQTVRRHFREWCARMLHEEQGSPEEIQNRRQEAPSQDWGFPVRYGFCVQVDEASMRSVISEEGERWVKLIKGDWESREVTGQQQQEHETRPENMAEGQSQDNDDEGEFSDVEDDEEYPAIEGCTDEDVGWMKVQLVGLMPDFYANLRDPNLWHVQYIRPPDMATA